MVFARCPQNERNVLRSCYAFVTFLPCNKHGGRNMTQHGTSIGKKHGGNLQGDEITSKPKKDAGIRQRSWKTPDGAKKSAWQADAGKVNGKRLMRSFPTKAEAQNWLYAQKLLIKDQGKAAMTLSDRQRVDAIRGIAALSEAGISDTIEDAVKCYVAAKMMLDGKATIEDAVKCFKATTTILDGSQATPETAARYYCERKAPKERVTVTRLVDEHIADCVKRNIRPITLRDLNHRLGLFKAMYGKKLITEIEKKEIDAWIQSRGEISNVTKKNYIRLGGGLFNYAIEQEYLTENPFTKKTRSKKDHADEVMPDCISWQEVTALLNSAAKNDASMVAPLAIGCFCGLRTAELRGIEWPAISFAEKRITVSSKIAKKRQTRYVTMPDNLSAWLLPYRQTSGFVAPQGEKWRSRFDNVRAKAGIRWPNNAMRHAFASHHIAMFEDAPRTAHLLGHHADTSMLFEHYRSLIKKEDAEKYWQIMPIENPQVMQMPIKRAG
jgi:integrase